LIHLIDATGDDPVEAWHTVCEELEAYGAGLVDKPQIVALNKGDLLDDELMADISAQLEAAGAQAVIAISGATGQGVDKVLDRVIAALPDKSSVETSSGDNEEGEWSPI
jgi:GTP-binding protein